MKKIRIILRLVRKQLVWMASLAKLIYYVVKLVDEAVNYAKHLYAQVQTA